MVRCLFSPVPRLAVVAGMAVAGSSGVSTAAEWLAAGGGAFGTPANWSGGVVPGSQAQVTFGIAGEYGVSFNGPRTNDKLTVTAGSPTLNLGGHIYECTGFGFAGTPLAVSVSGGTLAVAGGELKSTQIAVGAGQTGALAVKAGGIVRSGPGTTFGAGLSVGIQEPGSLTVFSGGEVVASILRAGVEGTSAIISQGLIRTGIASLGSEGNTSSTVWIVPLPGGVAGWENDGLLVVGGGLATGHLKVENGYVTTGSLEVGIRPDTVNPPGSGFPDYTNLGVVELEFGGSMEVAGDAHFGGSGGVSIGNAQLRTSETGTFTVGGALHLYPGATITQSSLEPGPTFDFGSIVRHAGSSALFNLAIQGSMRIRGPLDMTALGTLTVTRGSTLRVDGPLHLRPAHPLALTRDPALPTFLPTLQAANLKGDGGLTLGGGLLKLESLHLGGPEADARASLVAGSGTPDSVAIEVEESVIISPDGTLDLRGATLTSAALFENHGTFNAVLATVDAPFRSAAGSTLESKVGVTFRQAATLAADIVDGDPGGEPPRVEFQSELRLGSADAAATLSIEADVILGGSARTVMKIGGPFGHHDQLAVGCGFTRGGTLEVQLLAGHYFRHGQIFELFTATSFTGSFAEILLPILPAGLVWDTTGLDAGMIATRGLTFVEWMDALPPADQPPPGQRGPDDTPGNDGVPNFLKYAMGILPLEPAAVGGPALFLMPRKTGPPTLALELERSRFARADWQLETSGDLVDWMDVVETVQILEPDLPGFRERVRLISPVPVGEESAAYLRARVLED